jgi:hypothetical protein
MVYSGTLFMGDNGAFLLVCLCIPMKIGVKFEHCAGRGRRTNGFSDRGLHAG